MLKRLFEAVNGLISAVLNLRSSVTEIDAELRDRAGLPPRGPDGEPVEMIGDPKRLNGKARVRS